YHINCLRLLLSSRHTDLHTLSLHDALPISGRGHPEPAVRQSRREPHPGAVRRPRGPAALSSISRLFPARRAAGGDDPPDLRHARDRKSTRLNSSHVKISYAVVCLKKKTYRL